MKIRPVLTKALLLLTIVSSAAYAETYEQKKIKYAAEQYQEALNELANGNQTHAIQSMHAVLDQVPEFHPVRLHLVNLYREAGDVHRAKVLLQQGLKLDDDNPDFISQMGDLQRQSKTTALSKAASDVADIYRQALNELKHRNTTTAKDLLHQVLKLAPAFHPARAQLAQVYINRDQLVEADMLLTSGLNIDEDNSTFQELKDKIKQLNKVARVSLSPTVHVETKTTQNNSNEPVVTGQFVKKMIDLSREEKAALNYKKALYQEKQGDYQGAIDRLLAVLKELPAYHPARVQLIQIYERQGLHDRALEQAKHGIRLESDNPQYINLVAKEYLRLGDSKAALAALLKMPAAHRSNVTYQSLMALSYYDQRIYEAARSHYKKLVVMDSRNGRWWLGLGLAQENLGLKLESQKSLIRVKKIGHLDKEVLEYVDKKLAEYK